MPACCSPSANAEVWREKPEDHVTWEERALAPPAPKSPAPGAAELWTDLRAARLAAAGYLMPPDYPLEGEAWVAVVTYRRANLPA